MKHFYVLLVVATLLLSAPAVLADVNQFAGKWKNVDPNTRGLSALQIDIKGQRVGIQAWGRCHPSDCAWGYAEGTAYGPAVEANLAESAQAISTIYLTSFSQMILIIRPVDGGKIRVELVTKFTDQSGRANTRRVDTFSRAE
jgi:hypothetical protein